MFSILIPLALIYLAVTMWIRYGRPRTTGFLSDFAKLLDRPEFVEGFANRVIKRSFLKGEFGGRKVVVLLQRMNKGKYAQKLVVSMETHADVQMESYEFTGDKADRETELALFALEVHHKFKLRHRDRCLKAMWLGGDWSSVFSFPGRFDPPLWQSVLEKMHTVAGSLERRAA